LLGGAARWAKQFVQHRQSLLPFYCSKCWKNRPAELKAQRLNHAARRPWLTPISHSSIQLLEFIMFCFPQQVLDKLPAKLKAQQRNAVGI